MTDPIPANGFDAAWCRWVASFVPSPDSLVDRIGRTLKPGGVAIFHEYGEYATWRLSPPRPSLDRFVAEVMASWRANGGDPDVGRVLPMALRRSGFAVRDVRPMIFAVRPTDFMWQWPSTFLRSGVRRLAGLGRVNAAFADALIGELDEAERDPHTLMMTPLVVEIIATRSASATSPS